MDTKCNTNNGTYQCVLAPNHTGRHQTAVRKITNSRNEVTETRQYFFTDSYSPIKTRVRATSTR